MELRKQLKLSELENSFWAIQAALATSADNPVDNLRQYIMTENISDTNDVYSNMVRRFYFC